jgi:pimeloyl-ACP methyl ester carboxylesterase
MAEPLVLLPDFMTDARLFAPQVAAIARDRPVTVAPLAPGDRVETVAAALLPLLPRQFALAGAGLGGAVALDLLARAPDRVQRIALIAATPLAETPVQAAAREAHIVAARAGRLTEALAADNATGDADLAGCLAAMAAALGPEAFVRQTRMLQRRPDQQAALRRIRQPALVLCGAADDVLPVRRHEHTAAMIPLAALRVIDGAGRWPTLQAPEAVTAALTDWLRQPLVLR